MISLMEIELYLMKLENRKKENLITWEYIIQCNTKNEKVASLLKVLTLFKMGLFGAAHSWGDVQKGPLSLKSLIHILQWWNLAQLYLTKNT